MLSEVPLLSLKNPNSWINNDQHWISIHYHILFHILYINNVDDIINLSLSRLCWYVLSCAHPLAEPNPAGGRSRGHSAGAGQWHAGRDDGVQLSEQGPAGMW